MSTTEEREQWEAINTIARKAFQDLDRRMRIIECKDTPLDRFCIILSNQSAAFASLCKRIERLEKAIFNDTTPTTS